MILFKNRLVFGIIRKILSSLLSAVYKIISLLNLQLTLLVVLIGLVLYLTGVFENRVYLVIFYFLIILSIVFSIYGTIKKLLGIGKKVEKKKNVQIIDKKADDELERAKKLEQEEESEQESPKNETYPKYYKVKQRENCIMSEFIDIYELFEKRNGEWVRIRTDKK